MIRAAAEMRSEVRDNMRGGEGSVTISHYFDKSEFAANLRLCARLTLPPGSGIGSHEHAAEDEVYIVVKGSGILDDGPSQTRVSTGDAVLTGQGGSHAVRNDGDEDLEIIAFIMCYGQKA